MARAILKRLPRLETLSLDIILISLVAPLVFTYLFFGSSISISLLDILLETIPDIFLQATLSTVVSLFFGAALGLAINSKSNLSYFLLGPNLIPPLILAGGWLPLFFAIGIYPGFWMVVGVHVVLNVGLVAFSVMRIAQARWVQNIDQLVVLGGNRFDFLKMFLRGEKRAIASVAFIGFFLCLNSFFVAALFGGDQILTIDQLMFNLLRDRLTSTYVFPILLFQFLSYVIFLSFLHLDTTPRRSSFGFKRHYFASQTLTCLAGTFFFILSLLSLWGFWDASLKVFVADDTFKNSMSFTLIRAAVVSVTFYVLFSLILFWSISIPWNKIESKWANRSLFILDRMLPLSFVCYIAVGFLFVRFFSESIVVSILLCFYFMPLFWFWFGKDNRESLRSSLQKSQVLGADALQSFKKVILPLIHQKVSLLSGLVGVWAAGDFALESFFRGQQTSLALLVQESLVAFRTDIAAAANVVLVLLCALIFFVWIRISRVYN